MSQNELLQGRFFSFLFFFFLFCTQSRISQPHLAVRARSQDGPNKTRGMQLKFARLGALRLPACPAKLHVVCVALVCCDATETLCFITQLSSPSVSTLDHHHLPFRRRCNFRQPHPTASLLPTLGQRHPPSLPSVHSICLAHRVLSSHSNYANKPQQRTWEHSVTYIEPSDHAAATTASSSSPSFPTLAARRLFFVPLGLSAQLSRLSIRRRRRKPSLAPSQASFPHLFGHGRPISRPLETTRPGTFAPQRRHEHELAPRSSRRTRGIRPEAHDVRPRTRPRTRS